MEGEDSLFAGMDFVSPFTLSDEEAPLSSPYSAPRDFHDFSDQPTIGPPNTETSTQKLLDKPDQKAKHQYDSVDSILAAYDSKIQPPSSKQNVDASKPGVRRKRRSVKIGYGRDDVDEVRSASGQDETASNGSAIEELSIGLPKLIVVAHDGISTTGRQEAVISPVRNGSNGHQIDLSMTSDDFDAKQEELANNFTMLTGRLDIGDLGMHKSEVQSSDLAMVCGNLHDVSKPLSAPTSVSSEIKESGLEQVTEVFHCAEAGPGEPMKEDIEVSFIPQSAHATEEPSLADSYHDIEISNKDSKTVSHVSEFDALDLEVKVSPGVSMEERLGLIQKTVAMNTECIQQRIAAVSQARKAATQKRRQMAEEVSRTTAKFKEVEEEIQLACEREDFEKAEKLDEALILAEQAREAAVEEFRAIETEYDKYASKMQEVLQMQITSEEESFLQLEQLRQDAADAADQLKKDSHERNKAKIDALATDEASMKLEKENLMLELQTVEEANSELCSRIKTLVQTESEEKQTLVEERQVLLQELDALLAAVRLKESQIAEHEKKLGDLEERINNRVAGFDKETVELKANHQLIVTALENLEKNSEELAAQKIQVDAELMQAQEAARKLDELSSATKIEAQKLQDALLVRKTAAQAASSSKEKRLSLAAQEKQHVEDAHSLRNHLASLRILIQERASDKVKLHQVLLSANQQISSVEKRGPEIEAEKRLAAGSRNFKEAGRLAAEAKALLLSKEKLVCDVKKVTEDLERLEQELESRMSELSELEGQVQQKENEAAMARCEMLRLLAAATRDERDAAAELEDFEEAKSLDIEAEAADREADEIQKDFGFDADTC